MIWLIWPAGVPAAAVVERTRWRRRWRQFVLGLPARRVRTATITEVTLIGLTPAQAATIWEEWLASLIGSDRG
jgi:hypothetical protein